jgi:MscS family membrane protein
MMERQAAQGPEIEGGGSPQERLTEFFDEFLSSVQILNDHPALRALVVLFGFFLLAKVLEFILCRVLSRLAASTSWLIDDKLIDMLHGPIVKSTVIVGLAFAAHALGLGAPWSERIEDALLTLALLVWVPFAYRATSLLLGSASADGKRFKAIEPRTFPLFDNFAKIVLFGGIIYAVIAIWGADPSGFLASAGIAGVAIGFAAKDTLSNLIAGVFIIGDAPYRVGDFITLDTGARGMVANIGLRSTRLLTRDDIEITVPNAIMGQATIINEAGGPSPKHRIHLQVGVAYGTDIDQVREVLLDVARGESRISRTPEPRVRFRSFGDSGLDFELLCWIPEPWQRGQVLDALHCAVYKGFAAEGIEIPYPKRDVYVRGMPGGESGTGTKTSTR